LRELRAFVRSQPKLRQRYVRLTADQLQRESLANP
jgi:hypothetical protein